MNQEYAKEAKKCRFRLIDDLLNSKDTQIFAISEGFFFPHPFMHINQNGLQKVQIGSLVPTSDRIVHELEQEPL